ncbi:MAG: dTDP-4-dehydrorhamnose 3,5-epimerase family protein [Capsulimonas sp.]|uniref:dTDP-4-dehydrorhamnose 3,5-epimerase family protein n=1 Tax=Capsulimonas sp. TaxID=2494211 RepID=UPI0032650029
MYSPAWGIHPEPLVYAYQVRINRGQGRGWVVHAKQDDRIHHCVGTLHWAFYDDRKDSPTYGMLNKITISERNTALVIIPQGVWHAVMNVGNIDAIMINLPTRVYNHADPDKFRLPFHNDLIPYDFSDLGPQ